MAAAKHRAAIDVDEFMDTPLGEMSAADFVKILNHSKLRDAGLNAALADKKKVELWVDEGPILDEIPLRELIERLRAEKKKYELEPPPFVDERVRRPERAADYARVAELIADRVAERIGPSR